MTHHEVTEFTEAHNLNDHGQFLCVLRASVVNRVRTARYPDHAHVARQTITVAGAILLIYADARRV